MFTVFMSFIQNKNNLICINS